jgi:protein-disulfide isomerase
MHEAALAVNQVAPARFWVFSRELFRAAEQFHDVRVVREARNDTYARLAEVAARAGVDGAEVLRRLRIPDEPAEGGGANVGNAVTADVKTVVKMARLTGVHVSPTVIFDGVVAGDISSGWGEAEWKEFFVKNVG